MFTNYKLITILASPLLLCSGCTAVLWSESDTGFGAMGKVIKKKAESKLIEQDQLLGFIQIQNKDLGNTSDFIIVGQKYAYQIDAGNKELSEILKLQIDPTYWRMVSGFNQDQSLSLQLYSSENKKKKKNSTEDVKFSTDVKFVYNKAQLSEIETQQLNHLYVGYGNIQPPDREKNPYYVVKIGMNGQVIGLNDELKNLKFQKFSHNYPINLYSQGDTKYTANMPKLLQKVALTPVTLVGDVMILPLAILLNIGSSVKGITTNK